MVQRFISLPALDRCVSLGNYVAGIRIAKANPAATFKHGLTCWWSCTGAEIMGQFREGLHDRIDAAQPYSQLEHFRPAPRRGRKDCHDWFMCAWRDSRRLRDMAACNLAVHQFETDEARRRFGHRLTPWD